MSHRGLLTEVLICSGDTTCNAIARHFLDQCR
jgi:hypothetical protein